MGEEAQRLLDLLEGNETLAPDPPAFSGLFIPSLFKPLLHKARATTKLGGGATALATAMFQDPGQAMFSDRSADKEEVPAPPLFLEVVKHQWAWPGAFPNLGGNDRRFYNMDQGFSQAFQV